MKKIIKVQTGAPVTCCALISRRSDSLFFFLPMLIFVFYLLRLPKGPKGQVPVLYTKCQMRRRSQIPNLENGTHTRKEKKRNDKQTANKSKKKTRTRRMISDVYSRGRQWQAGTDKTRAQATAVKSTILGVEKGPNSHSPFFLFILLLPQRRRIYSFIFPFKFSFAFSFLLLLEPIAPSALPCVCVESACTNRTKNSTKKKKSETHTHTSWLLRPLG